MYSQGDLMNLKLLPLLSILLTPIIAACTPEQINEAIEACKGDPACFEIVDEAIEEELAARGITGGRMTNIEMEKVSTFLQSFTLGNNENQFNFYKSNVIQRKSFALNYEGPVQSFIDNLNNLENDFYINDSKVIPSLDIFNLPLINPENKQFFYQGSGLTQVKYVLYKTGADVFVYEVYGDEEYIFSLHLGLESMFFRDNRYISPISMFKFYESNYSWDSILNNQPIILKFEWGDVNFFRTENEFGHFITQKVLHPAYPTSGVRPKSYNSTFVSFNTNDTFSISINFIYDGIEFRFHLEFFHHQYSPHSFYTPIKVGSMVYEINEETWAQQRTIQEWIDWSKSQSLIHSEFVNYDNASLMNDIAFTYSSFLNDILTFDY